MNTVLLTENLYKPHHVGLDVDGLDFGGDPGATQTGEGGAVVSFSPTSNSPNYCVPCRNFVLPAMPAPFVRFPPPQGLRSLGMWSEIVGARFNTADDAKKKVLDSQVTTDLRPGWYDMTCGVVVVACFAG